MSQEDEFGVFGDMCEAFNSLDKRHLDDPFEARPFRYLHEEVELQDYPDIPGATWHVGHIGEGGRSLSPAFRSDMVE
jgi:hypothetical protein